MHDVLPRGIAEDLRRSFFGFDTIFDDLVHKPLIEKYPPDNVMEVEGEYIIQLAVSGFTKDDIEIERLNNKLVIKGNKQEEEEIEEVNYICRNIAQRSFVKTYRVSNDYDDIQVKLNNGMLYINMRKTEEQTERKLLEIQ